MNRDVNYNYLIENSIDNWPADFNVDGRPDPDSISKNLYDDLKRFILNEAVMKDLKINDITNKEQVSKYGNKLPFYTLFVDGREHRLSADYIGASVYWAIEKNVKHEQIIHFLKIGRKLGGHMLWPRGFTVTINTARSGNEGFYDRIDWTLVLLKLYFEHGNDKEAYLEKAIELIPEGMRYKQHINRIKRMYHAFFNSRRWLQKFDSFEKFCEIFALSGCFVNDDTDVILMADLFPVLPIDYNRYIDNVCEAINIRTEKLYSRESKSDLSCHTVSPC